MQVFFEQRQELAPGIWQYDFRPERMPDFVPGQYVDLRLDGVAGDPRGSARTFSMISMPTDPSISFLLKHFELQSPYKHVLQALQPGDAANITDAMGDLVLPKDPAMPLVFVAGGIGIASFTAMLRQLIAKREERHISLFYALRSQREQVFTDLIKAYPLALYQKVIAPNRLTAQEIIDSTPPDSFIYLSGSERFVEGLRADLVALGIPHERLVFDYFDGYIEL